MTEDFLHYLWRFKRLKPDPWHSTQGHSISVIHTGFYNENSGPDFYESRIQIDNHLWIGSVEIHLKSSDWDRHRHQFDPAYNNVILHVVYECDKLISCANGLRPICLELKGLFDEQLYWRFEQLLQQKKGIPCKMVFPSINGLAKQEMLDRCAVLRLQSKSQSFNQVYQSSQGDWHLILYWAIARSLGGKVNALAMEALVNHLPLRIWQQYLHHDNLRMILFLGCSGILNPQDEVSAVWQREFNFLRHKHQLQTMDDSQWKYSRMRPAAFPDRRIAQLAAILPMALNWFSEIREGNTAAWESIHWPELDGYWQHRYRIGHISAKRIGTRWSESLQTHLKINVLIPVLFFYGQKVGNQQLSESAFQVLQEMPAEDNKIVRSYEQLGLSISSAFDSQALLAWYEEYCRPKKCLTCTLGKELLNQGS